MEHGDSSCKGDCKVPMTNIVNTITLSTTDRSVSATFPSEESLQEVLVTVEGLIKALGYCFEGHLDIVEED